MPRPDPPVTQESIDAAKQAAAIERAAAGIICDDQGRIIFDLKQKNADRLERPA